MLQNADKKNVFTVPADDVCFFLQLHSIMHKECSGVHTVYFANIAIE